MPRPLKPILLLALLAGSALYYILGTEPSDVTPLLPKENPAQNSALEESQPLTPPSVQRLETSAEELPKPPATPKQATTFLAGVNPIFTSFTKTDVAKYSWQKADLLKKKIAALKAINPDFESYPFLDPHQTLRDYGGQRGRLMMYDLQNELLQLERHPYVLSQEWMGDGGSRIDRTFSSDYGLALLTPTWVVAAPVFGDVDLDTVLEQRQLLQDIRREYLFDHHAAVRKLTFYDVYLQTPDRPFSPKIREAAAINGNSDYLSQVDFSETFSAELQLVKDEMKELRHQYLLALGNAVFAMQMPTFND